jgi:hypothetical protein
MAAEMSRSLHAAALQLLREEPDPLARLCLLRDALPAHTLEELQQALREAAVLHLAARP